MAAVNHVVALNYEKAEYEQTAYLLHIFSKHNFNGRSWHDKFILLAIIFLTVSALSVNPAKSWGIQTAG